MQGDDGVSRCNSPFMHCKRYQFSGELRVGPSGKDDATSSHGSHKGSDACAGRNYAIGAGSSVGTKNCSEWTIGAK
jgi:hypothetical protein